MKKVLFIFIILISCLCLFVVSCGEKEESSGSSTTSSPLYVAVLILGIVACAGAIFLMFKGVNTLIKALFD